MSQQVKEKKCFKDKETLKNREKRFLINFNIGGGAKISTLY